MTELGRAPAEAPTVAVFAMTEGGHFQRLRPLIAGLADGGARVHVFTDHRFRGGVEEEGATFVDLFGRYPLGSADDESVPVPCRFVSFAGRYAEAVAADVEALGTSLIVYDTFAVIGRVVARILDLPHVNVCAGHNMDPRRAVAELEADARRRISPRCERAVKVLRDRFGIANASPFSYVDGISPYLNLYCEPLAFLAPEDRRAFEPIAFHGSLPAPERIEALCAADGRDPFDAGATLKVYVSFGTVIWRYWPREALAALATISSALSRREGVSVVISVGGCDLGPGARRKVEAPNVSVESYVRQWRVLVEADLIITHNGLNTTHEAIYCQVLMASYPFFSDQPALAKRCREMGIAMPLAEEPRGALEESSVRRTLDALLAKRERMRANLAAARSWELETIAARPAVWDQVMALSRSGRRPASR